MLTVAHGVCLIDAGDAVIRGFATGGGTFNAVEFCMRINIIGVGRSIRHTERLIEERKSCTGRVYFLRKNKEDYITGLKCLRNI